MYVLPSSVRQVLFLTACVCVFEIVKTFLLVPPQHCGFPPKGFLGIDVSHAQGRSGRSTRSSRETSNWPARPSAASRTLYPRLSHGLTGVFVFLKMYVFEKHFFDESSLSNIVTISPSILFFFRAIWMDNQRLNVIFCVTP